MRLQSRNVWRDEVLRCIFGKRPVWGSMGILPPIRSQVKFYTIYDKTCA